MKTLEKKDAAIFLSWLEENDHIITERDIDRMYEDMLDEYPVSIGSLSYSGSYALRKLDPIAYRCGFLDFADGQFSQLCDYGMDSDDYVEDIDSLWYDFEDEMLITCDICGELCLASDAVSISSEDDGHSERACPNCRKN